MNHTVSIPQRALVTGSGKRLGQAMAVALAGRGFKVALHYNSSSSGVLDTLKAVQAAGGDGALVQCDLSDEAAVEVLVALRETFRAQADYSKARYAYILNSLRLKEGAGSLTAADLEEINTWLQ